MSVVAVVVGTVAAASPKYLQEVVAVGCSQARALAVAAEAEVCNPRPLESEY